MTLSIKVTSAKHKIFGQKDDNTYIPFAQGVPNEYTLNGPKDKFSPLKLMYMNIDNTSKNSKYQLFVIPTLEKKVEKTFLGLQNSNILDGNLFIRYMTVNTAFPQCLSKQMFWNKKACVVASK